MEIDSNNHFIGGINMGDECEVIGYCSLIDKFKDQSIDFITANAEYTDFNKDRLETLKQLGGPTALCNCDKSYNWYLRWWAARYDFQSAINIAKECYERQLDFANTGSVRGFFLMERSLKSIYGPLADYVHLL